MPFPDALRVVGLAAGGNIDLLVEQVERYGPELVSVRNPADVATLRRALTRRVEIVCGADGASAVASMPSAGAVIAAIVGAAGIPPVHAALMAGKRVGIANKEVLVAAGDVMTRAAAEHGGEILPVDSEHNAVHQALRCGEHREVQRIILTRPADRSSAATRRPSTTSASPMRWPTRPGRWGTRSPSIRRP